MPDTYIRQGNDLIRARVVTPVMSNQLLLAVEGESLISKEKPSISELTPSFDGL